MVLNFQVKKWVEQTKRYNDKENWAGAVSAIAVQFNDRYHLDRLEFTTNSAMANKPESAGKTGNWSGSGVYHC